MKKNKIKLALAKEEGSGLVLALMVLLILSVLGASLGMVTVGSYRLGDANRDHNSAYYIAEAGANMAYEEVEDYVLKAYEASHNQESFFEKMEKPLGENNNKSSTVYGNFESQFGKQPQSTIQVRGDVVSENSRKYIIEATGEVAGKKRIVEKTFEVEWTDKNTGNGGGSIPKIPEKAALIARNKLNILNGTIDGNAYISSTQKNSVKLAGGQGGNRYTIVYPTGISYEEILDKSAIYKPVPDFVQQDSAVDWSTYESLLEVGSQFDMPPQTKTLEPYEYKQDQWNKYWLIERDGSVNLTSWMLDEYTLDLSANLYIPAIKIESNKKLILNPENKDYTIYVDRLSVLSGSLDIKGTGSVTLVVRDTTSFRQNSLINQSGSSDQLRLVYTGKKSPHFSEITSINGHILSVGSKADIAIKNSGIHGVFLTDAKKISFSGGNSNNPSKMMMIAPRAEIELGSGYHIRGTLIGKTLTTTGGGTIFFKKIDTDGFSGGGGASEPAPPDTKNLISSKPALESD